MRSGRDIIIFSVHFSVIREVVTHATGGMIAEMCEANNKHSVSYDRK